MAKLRDFLIILVLGGVVLAAIVHFTSSVHEATVSSSVVVVQAENACIEDGVLCHVGSDSFTSVEDAQAYLDGPEHQKALKITSMKKAQDQADAELHEKAKQMAGKGVGAVRAACLRDGTFNCALIDKNTAEDMAYSILRSRQDRGLRS